MKIKIEDYKIPLDSRIVSVEAIDNKLIIGFEPEHYGDFHCDLTDHVEEVPRIGDTAYSGMTKTVRVLLSPVCRMITQVI